MNKKNISIVVGVIVIAIIIVLLILFGNKKYIVDFDSKGGSPVESQEVKRSGTVTRPEDPTWDGHVFDNWYYEDKIYDFDTPVKKNFTLEARWLGEGDTDNDGKFTITFNTGAGSKIDSIKVDKDGYITEPDEPTRDGYKFVEWQYNGKKFDFKNTKVTGNMTLVAVWEKDGEADDGSVKLTLSVGNFSLTVGNSRKITATTKNTNKSVTWSSSNTKVATVDKNGNVTAVGVGTAKITATVDGVTKTITVTVTAKSTGTGSQGGQQNPGTQQPEQNDPTPEEPEQKDPTPEQPSKDPKDYIATCDPIAQTNNCRITIRHKVTGQEVSGYAAVTFDGTTINKRTGSEPYSYMIDAIEVYSID